jgi:hypothetical protein
MYFAFRISVPRAKGAFEINKVFLSPTNFDWKGRLNRMTIFRQQTDKRPARYLLENIVKRLFAFKHECLQATIDRN